MSSFSSDKYQFLLNNSSHHKRTTTSSSSNAQKKNPSQRPPPLTRPSTVRLSKTGPVSPSTKRKGKTSEEEKFDMATGFLPFCAMCEKQIITPHSSVLYCSQSCQNQDSRKPLSASSVSLSPAPTPPSSPVFSRSIVPRLEPTKLPPSTSPTTATAKATSPRIPDHTYDVTSDLDPAEWNPLRRHSEFVHHNAPVGCFDYFSPAHRRAHSVPNNRHNRNTSVASLNRHVPSLSNSPSSSPTPSPSPSPTLTHATPATTAEETENHEHDSTSKHYRPLPPLHKPSLSAGGSSKRGVELVMPQAAVRLAV